MDLTNLKQQFLEKLEKVDNLKDLDSLYTEYFGREKGCVTAVLRNLKNLGEEERKKIGAEANALKKELEEILNKKKEELARKETEEKLKKEWFDITAPGKKIPRGTLHPITKTFNDIVKIFSKMGFSVADGPEVETEFYNFDALNIPFDHPAREMWDTFWIKSERLHFLSDSLEAKSPMPQRSKAGDRWAEEPKGEFRIKEKLLLRTHTSPVQIRYMLARTPPFRIIAPGRVFRYEALDSGHSHTFYQLEGLMVGEDVSVANFKTVIQEFFSRFFKKEIKVRLRPSYFPFVEPGFEVDISCVVCAGKGCGVCKNMGWVEVAGAGMVHRNVFKAVGYNPSDWQGFAFGFGIDRMVMMRHKIPDIRLLYSGDLRFLKQF